MTPSALEDATVTDPRRDARERHTHDGSVGKVLAQLGTHIEQTLEGVLGDAHAVALLDFPDHDNVGDSAIYLGEIEWLRRRRIAPVYVCSIANFSADALRRAVPDGPILLHGGGNFGNIWPLHQAFREAVLEAFPDRRIIQFPQTIHFDDVAAQHRAAGKIAAHGDVLLLVRDTRSFDLARDAFKCDVRLCPDMALALGPQRRPIKPRHDTLMLLRTDKETAHQGTLPRLPEGVVACDWLDEPPELRAQARRRSAYSTTLAAPTRAFDRNYQRQRFYQVLAEQRVARGLNILAAGSRVVTDRLHGHILSLLLGIPHTVLDNNYGKVSGFIEAWTKDCGLITRADNLESALAPHYPHWGS